MNNMEVRDFVKIKLEEIEFGRKIEDDTQLIEEEILNSLSIMYLISELEKSYEISIPLEDVVQKNFGTPLLIESYVNGRRKNAK